MDPPVGDPTPIRFLLEVWQRGGWIGVDLFFVLSGFLISGLLFREMSEHGGIKTYRFLARRGLKIYPAFYAFLAFTLGMLAFRGEWPPPIPPTVGEVVYLQNYLGGLWNHTWSLAVEEHFYILLPLLILTLQELDSKRGKKPLVTLPIVAVGVLLGCLFLRLLATGPPTRWTYDHLPNLFPTHLRIDGLMFGVLISYWRHFHPEKIRRVVGAVGGNTLLAGGIILLSPSFILELGEYYFTHTIGLTLNYLGSGMVLVHALWLEETKLRRAGVMARIGFYSYSIYLWHMPVAVFSLPFFQHHLGLPRGTWISVLVFTVTSCVVGIVMAKLIEMPVLGIRDRWLPSRSRDLPLSPSWKNRGERSGQVIRPGPRRGKAPLP